jgi:hypothetical protein
LPQVARAVQQYRSIATKFGLDPELIVRDYSTDDPELPRSPSGSEKPPTGKIIVEAHGRRFLIDASQREEAIKRGGKVVG